MKFKKGSNIFEYIRTILTNPNRILALKIRFGFEYIGE